eukprot:Tbor_TRINITY_DN5250_c0_g3::TRINITY_DN5250_c0_g3_i1::g.16646::m.16646/K17914/KIF13; kinesin family member 13
MSSRTSRTSLYSNASPTSKNSRGNMYQTRPGNTTIYPSSAIQSPGSSSNCDPLSPEKSASDISDGYITPGAERGLRGSNFLTDGKTFTKTTSTIKISPYASQNGSRRVNNVVNGNSPSSINASQVLQSRTLSKNQQSAPIVTEDHLKVFVRLRSFTSGERDNLIQALNINRPTMDLETTPVSDEYKEDGCDSTNEDNTLLEYQKACPNFNIDHIIPLRMKDSTCEVTVAGRGSFPFSFDECFWSNKDIQEEDKEYASQETLFEKVGRPLVENALLGFNSSIIAYGQTGSGKTYSIFGPGAPSCNPARGALGTLNPNSEENGDLSSYCRKEELGLIPRVCEAIFAKLNGRGANGSVHTVHVSIVEIYLEEVYDLLNNRKRLAVRQDSLTSFGVVGSRQVPVQSYHDVLQLIKQGDTLKTCAKTAINERSSRAHTFFQLEVETITETGKRTAKVLLADLAGCERIKLAKTDKGTALDEACNINLSLLTLGTCIEAAVQKGKQGKTIEHMGEFRQSTLTKLLKEFICGNSRTAMLVTVAPTVKDVNLTLQALRFADRAKQIQTHATINHVPQFNSGVNSEAIRQAYDLKKSFLDRECEMEIGFDNAKRRYCGLLVKQANMLEEQDSLIKNLNKRAEEGAPLTAEEVQNNRSRLNYLETELRATKRLLLETEREKDSLQARLIELCNESTTYTEKEALEDQIHCLRLELEVVKDELAQEVVSNNIEVEQHKAEIARLKEELLQSKVGHSLEVSNLQHSLARVMELSNKKVSLLEETVAARDQKLATYKEDLAAFSTELENQKLNSEKAFQTHNEVELQYKIKIDNQNNEREKLQSAFDAQENTLMRMSEDNILIRENYDLLNKYLVLFALEFSDCTLQKANMCLDTASTNFKTIFNSAQEKWDDKCLVFESEIKEAKDELSLLQKEAHEASTEVAKTISNLEERNTSNILKHNELLLQMEKAKENHMEEIAKLEEEHAVKLSAVVEKLEDEKRAIEQAHAAAFQQKYDLSANLAHQCELAKNTLEAGLEAFNSLYPTKKKDISSPQRSALYSLHFADGSPVGNSAIDNMAKKSIIISEKLTKITEKLKL